MHSLEVFESYTKLFYAFHNLTYALHKYPGIPVCMKFSQFSM